MRTPPQTVRAAVFVDGQNLFYAVRESFGYIYPNFDVLKLAQAVCQEQKWALVHTAFYTGIPSELDNARWHHFWVAKLLSMSRQGVKVYSRQLRYRNKTLVLPDGTPSSVMVGQEKGIDVRLALDVIHSVYRQECDVVLLFSQDQDLSEVAGDVRLITKEQDRWMKIASAFPYSPTTTNRRGIDKTDWLRVDRATYDACLDTRDYRALRP